MTIETSPFNGADQRVLRLHDSASGARGVIVVDSTLLGPAMGGCRLWRYETDAAAETDARRLARGMSYKNALAGLPMGGGKSVLRLPDGPFDRRDVFTAFGRAVNAFAGAYVTAEDVGTTERDMETMRAVTPYVFGLPADGATAGGDPSPWTALGVFVSIRALCARAGLDLAKAKVAVQGVGSVGAHLCDLLHAEGVELVVSDVDEVAVRRVAGRLPALIVAPEDIHRTPATIFAPCALGAGLNATTIPQLGAEMIVGAANNQLATATDGELLMRRGVLYAPDYVVNAGGVINVAAEYLVEDQASVRARVEQTADRLLAVIARAEREEVAPSTMADRMAQEILARRVPALA